MKQRGFYHGVNSKNNVISLLEENTKYFPDKPIFFWKNRNQEKPFLADGKLGDHAFITYKTFTLRARRLAEGFQSIGIQKSDNVLSFLPVSVPMYLVISALHYIGAVPVFIDSLARRNHLLSCVQQTRPKAMISVIEGFYYCRQLPNFPSIPLNISMNGALTKGLHDFNSLFASREATITAVDAEHSGLITFTSGSSGEPKGVDRSHRFLIAQHYALKRHLRYRKDDRDVPLFPVFSLNNIACGISTIIPDVDVSNPNDQDPQVLLDQIVTCSGTTATLSPLLFKSITQYCRQKKIVLPMLRRVVTGGAAISSEMIEDFEGIAPGVTVLVLYGSTEVEPIASMSGKHVRKVVATRRGPRIRNEGVVVGKIDKGLRLKFIHVTKHPLMLTPTSGWDTITVQKGSLGELIVAGSHVCERYMGSEDHFLRSKIVDANGTIWHRTGDVGRLDENGYLWLVGRVHNCIIHNGSSYFPLPVELALQKLPFIKQVAYLGIPDKQGQDSADVVVVPAQRAGSLKKERQWEKEISTVMQILSYPLDKIVFVPTIPMDARHHSKINYSELRQQLL